MPPNHLEDDKGEDPTAGEPLESDSSDEGDDEDEEESEDDDDEQEERNSAGDGSATGANTPVVGWANLRLAQEAVRMARALWRAEEESARLIVARRSSVRNLMAAVLAVITVKVVAGSRQFFVIHQVWSSDTEITSVDRIYASAFIAFAVVSVALFMLSMFAMFGFANFSTKVRSPYHNGKWQFPLHIDRHNMLASALLYVPSLATCNDAASEANHMKATSSGDLEPDPFVDGLDPAELESPNALLEVVYWRTMAASAQLHKANKRAWRRVGTAQNHLLGAFTAAVLGSVFALLFFVRHPA